jgi:amino acid adenylation domain-containing protein
MKLLLTMNLPYQAYNGTSRSNRALCEALAARRHQVSVVVPALPTPSSLTLEDFVRDLRALGLTVQPQPGALVFQWNGVEVHAVSDPTQMRAYLVTQIQRLNPDSLLVSSEDPSQSLLEAALRAQPGRVVYLAHTPQMLPFGPASLYPSEARTGLVRQCVAVVTISHFVADYVRQWAGVEAWVNHPPHYGTGPFPNWGHFEEGYVLLMNASAVKGVSIFLALARAFPQIPFGALLGYGTRAADREALAALPNIELLKNTFKIDEIFCRTRILLMPSLWEEGFGLAAVEAMLRGIPVLASELGGLKEAKLGIDYLLPVQPITHYANRLDDNWLPAPVIPEQTIEPWRQALSTLLADRAAYTALSDASYAAAGKFVSGLSVEPFESLLRQLISQPRLNPEQSRGLSSELASAAGKDLSRTIASLTPEQRALLMRRLQEKAGSEAPGATHLSEIRPAPREGNLPLSFTQQQMWFVDQWEPGNPLYNTVAAFQFNGLLNPPGLEQAWTEMVHRHEVLRTTFVEVEGEPVQVIGVPETCRLTFVDLTGLPEAERLTEAQRLAVLETRKPYDLRRGPLFRLALLKLALDLHVLLVSMQHIITDGWSTQVLAREMTVLYKAFAAGQASPLPPLPIQYADYAVWQRQQLQGAVLEKQRKYWKSRLAGSLPILDLPTDAVRYPAQTFRGANFRRALPTALVERLKALGQARGATLHMVLLAGFAALLARYTGQTDLIVGMPMAGRTRTEIEDLIGCFVNTLPLRLNLSEDPTFLDLLAQVRTACLEAHAHQDLTFEKLVEEVRTERQLGYHPVFQVVFLLQNIPLEPVELPGLKITAWEDPTDSGVAMYDLILEFEETADSLSGLWNYNADLFKATTVAQWAGHFETLLTGVAGQPELSLSRLPLWTAPERAATLAVWAAQQANYRVTKCLHELFAEQAARQPEAVAVSCEGVHLTYQAVEQRANWLARRLRALGVDVESRVGVCLERRAELPVALLGVLKAGGVYVPLDPAYPSERLAYMTDDAKVKVIVTERTLAGQLEPIGGERVWVEEWDLTAEPANFKIEPENLAYVIYTSGSTGRPKGVMVSHANVMRLLETAQTLFRFTEEDVWTLFHSYAFDFSVWEIWGAWGYGGRLVVIPYWVSRSPSEFYERLVSEGVTVLNQTPSAFRQLSGVEEERGREAGLKLNWVIFGGEALEAGALTGWWARRPVLERQPRLVNMYGITETTVHVTWRELKSSEVEGRSPIGGPLTDLQVYVLDGRMEPVPPGVAGEIYVGGAGLARGYLGRPELTAERFVPNPFVMTEHGRRMTEDEQLLPAPHRPPSSVLRLYKTGDRARWTSDGNLEYLGRLDHQVKIRGFRIELGEIEAALSAYPGVRECVAVARDGSHGEKRLVGYLAGEVDAGDVRQYLRERLPEYMVPVLVKLPALPLTANGKINTQALPEPEVSSAVYVEPQSEMERAVAGIWAEVLQRQPVGARDNFFELGGHSLAAVQVVARLRKRLGIETSLRWLFEEPVLMDFVRTVEAQAEAGRTKPEQVISIRPRPRSVSPLEKAKS